MSGLLVRSHMNAGQDGFRDKSSKQKGDLIRGSLGKCGVSLARADRRELNRMLGKLAPGDVVTVTRIDRLARSTLDLFAIVKRIVDACP
jgi:DNA invertase Pin-like site-specific DNA recombinase